MALSPSLSLALQRLEMAILCRPLPHSRAPHLLKSLFPHPAVQGAKCCIIGQPQSFFTLYRPALDSGQPGGRVCQFDREGQLMASGAAGEELAAAVQAAATGAGCMLVSCELAAREGFPFSAFQAVVVYASEPDSQAALRQRLEGVQCPLHFLELSLPVSFRHGQDGGATAALHQPTSAEAAAKASAEAIKGVARVCHVARPVAATGVPAQPGAAAPGAAGMEWPLIISSDPGRPIR